MSDVYFIGIRVDDIKTPTEPIDLIGHAMIVLTAPSGMEYAHGMMPIYPEGVDGKTFDWNNSASWPGQVIDQKGSHSWDFEKRISVSKAQYDAAMAFALRGIKGAGVRKYARRIVPKDHPNVNRQSPMSAMKRNRNRPLQAVKRLSVVETIHETSTILRPVFCAAKSCRWSAETKVSGSTARAHAT